MALSEAATVAPPTPPRATPPKKSPGRQKRKAAPAASPPPFVDPTLLPIDTSDAEAVSIATQAAESAKRYSRDANEYARTTRMLQQVQSRVASSADLVLSSATLDQTQRSTLLTLAASLSAASSGGSSSQAAASSSQASQSSSQADLGASQSDTSSQLALSSSAVDGEGEGGDVDGSDEPESEAGGYRALVEGRKRRCHCKNSRCLKLYCECFTAGVYCSACSCIGCQNNEMHEELVSRAINETLERNPDAFTPPSIPLPDDADQAPPGGAPPVATQSARHLSSLSVTRQLTGDQRLRSLARDLLAQPTDEASSAEAAVLTSLAEYLEKAVARLERIGATTPGCGSSSSF
jgi:hypothetical protein